MENKQSRTKGHATPGESSAQAPKTTTKAVEKAKPKKKAAPKIKQRITENQAAVYESFKNKGPAYMIMTRNVRVYDEESDRVRFANYCPAEPSIWKDEQSSDSRIEPIIFRSGYLTVGKDNPTLRQFLDVHPANKANGGNQFGIVNKKQEAEQEIEKEFSVHEAITLIKETDFNDLLAVAIYFKVNIDRKASEVKFDLLKLAKSKPNEFIQAFDDPMVKTRAVLRQANDYQLINVKPDSVRWFDSNSLIVSVPHGQDPVTILTRFCLTERGASVLSDLEDQLERLA